MNKFNELMYYRVHNKFLVGPIFFTCAFIISRDDISLADKIHKKKKDIVEKNNILAKWNLFIFF